MTAPPTHDSSNSDLGRQSSASTVSVVMPAFNSSRYIAQAIESVLAQGGVGDLEVVVVDDGSTDDTAAIVTALGSRVRLLRQHNQGAAVARNLGVREARGRYIAFLDADDYWYPDKLRGQLDALQDSVARACYGGFRCWYPDADGVHANPLDLRNTPPATAAEVQGACSGWIYPQLLEDCIVWTSTVVVERSLLDEVGGFDVSLRKGQDYDLWLRISQRTPWLGIDRTLALYRMHGESITRRVLPVNYEYTILTSALQRWGLHSPGGVDADAAMVQRRLTRSCRSFADLHLKHGDPRIARDAYRAAAGHGGWGVKLAARWLTAAAKSLRAE